MRNIGYGYRLPSCHCYQVMACQDVSSLSGIQYPFVTTRPLNGWIDDGWYTDSAFRALLAD